jgi:hypothetical protein
MKSQPCGAEVLPARIYAVGELSVPAEKYADWVNPEGVIGADQTAAAVLKRTP